MRKTLLTICAAVFALVAVSSCGKIWDEFDAVHGELDALTERVAELESKLNSDVATINSTIGALDAAYKAADKANADADATFKAEAEKKLAEVRAQVAVVDVKKNDAGNYVLTFANGDTLEVAAADSNANNTGLVTTVTEGDITYWAVVDKDGQVIKLDAVVHPDTRLSFKVNPETNELLVAYDGTNWEQTGVIVNDETTFNIVENFVDANDYVVLTVGGIEYKLPKVSQNYFEIISGMQYFTEYETKTIQVNMAGIVSYMVASAPEGWKVELTDKGLAVTSPGEWDDHEPEGKIVVWVVTEDGQTKVGTIKVALGAFPATFAFSNNFTDVAVTFGSNDMIYFGVTKASEYDAEAVVEMILASQEELAEGVFANGEDEESGNYNIEGEYKFAELLGSTPVTGETYTFWSVAPTWETDWSSWPPTSTMKVSTDDIVLNDVRVYVVTIASPTVTYKDASLDVKVEGADKFYIGFVDAYAMGLTQEDLPLMLEAYSGTNGLLDLLMNGMSMGFGTPMKITHGGVFVDEYKGGLYDFNSPNNNFYVIPGGIYLGVILPIFDNKTDYTVDDLIYFEPSIELPEVTLGGDATVTIASHEALYNGVKVSGETTGDRVYYGVVESGMYDVTDPNIGADLLHNLYMFSTTDDTNFEYEINTTISDSSAELRPETEYELLTFAVSPDGKCGNVVSLAFKTTAIETTDAIAITSIEASASNEVATATFTITGDAKALYYGMYLTSQVPTTDAEYAAFIKQVKMDYFTGGYKVTRVELDEKNLVNGNITLVGDSTNYSDPLAVGNGRPRVIFAFVQDADGKISEIVKSNEFHDATQE